jgi:hypothetical protein
MQVAIIATSVFALGGELKNTIHFGSERFSHAKVHKLGVARVCARVNELAITMIRDLGHRRKFDVVTMMVRVGAQLFRARLYVSTLPRVPNETRIALMR